VNDGKIQHPADSKAWKHVDSKFKWFLEKGMLGWVLLPMGSIPLACKVLLTPYGLCQKQSKWILLMLIPGPKSPRMDIDVYLRTLIYSGAQGALE
jgi:hypothetical protein